MDRSDRKQFLRKILDGLRQSNEDVFDFSGAVTYLARPEYIISVDVAKSIAELNRIPGHPYQIVLEEKTKSFARACIDSTPTEKKLTKLPLVGRHNATRNGKIDIAVYTGGEPFRQSVAAVEIKGFDPPQGRLIRDLKRNLEYFAMHDKAGQNLLALAAAAFLVSDNLAVFRGDEQKGRTSAYRNVARLLRKVRLSGVKVGLIVTTLSSNLVDRKEHERDSDNPYWEHKFEEASHVIGVVIYFYRAHASKLDR